MAGAILEGELTAKRAQRVVFGVATVADDRDIRQLLRENPMSGRILLSLEREPDYFADGDIHGEIKQTIVAREGGGLVCVGSCTVRNRFVNGEARRVGYLGGLRLDGQRAGRFDILRRGYEFFQELQRDLPADFYFTSIASDNERARIFLERGLSGMPRYEFIGEYVTVLLPAKNHRITTMRAAARDSIGDTLVTLLNDHNRCLQFAPCWSKLELTALQPLGLQPGDFRFIGDEVVAALWDQNSFKQAVIRGFAPWLKAARPGLNLLARMGGQARLPAVGQKLAHAFVSHLVVGPDDTRSLTALVIELSKAAAKRGIEFLTLGFSANDPRLIAVRNNFRGHEYCSRLYVVRWPELGSAAHELDGRFLAPEVALM